MEELKDINIFILCGGIGSRLKQVLDGRQKTMADFNGKPFLNIILEDLKNQGFRKIVLGTGYRSDDVEGYYRDNNFGLDISFSKEEVPLGTGGAVKHAKSFIASELFFVLNGDSYCRLDYKKFMDFHVSKNTCATIAVSKMDEKKDYGSIIAGEDNRIKAFLEKSDAKHAPQDKSCMYVNAGVYCFNSSVFEFMPAQETFSIEKDFFPSLVEKKIYCFEVNSPFVDIGTPERFNFAQKVFNERQK